MVPRQPLITLPKYDEIVSHQNKLSSKWPTDTYKATLGTATDFAAAGWGYLVGAFVRAAR
jgi:hypothetical protein